MRYAAFLIIPLILISLYGGCGDNCKNCNCVKLEDVNESQCLTEDFKNLCEFYSCRSSTYSFSFKNSSCEIVDCETAICEVRSSMQDDLEGLITIDQPGVITISGLDEVSNFPFGTVEVEEVIEEYDCILNMP